MPKPFTLSMKRTEGINAYLKALADFGYENGMTRQQVFDELMDQPDLAEMISDEMCRSGYVGALLDDLSPPNYLWPLTNAPCPSGDGYAAHQVIDGECAQCGQREAEEQRAEYETDLAKDPHEQAMREEYFERKGREQD